MWKQKEIVDKTRGRGGRYKNSGLNNTVILNSAFSAENEPKKNIHNVLLESRYAKGSVSTECKSVKDIR